MKLPRNIRAALTIAITLTLTGCIYPGGPGNQPGSNTPFDGLSTKTKTQLLDDVVQQVNDVAQLVGGEFLDDHELPFDPANLEQRATWSWTSCDNEATTGQYFISVRQLADPSTEFDPESVTEKVRTYWEGLGYTVRQIGPPEQSTTRGRSINVDLPHSAGLHFAASTQILGIGAHSECVKWD
ncbi:hypothetical protein AB4Z18_17195 [Leifsonia sp. 2TAF2]|uniref:hypothetical protein n=1 Tax=Leifsonia sp. 2TAF2 TaxID=3233009 RepID=UPI003F961AB7